MAQGKYADSVMKGNRGVFRGGDELIEDEFFPELAEEELRLNGGEYGAEVGYMEMDEFSSEEKFDYGPSSEYVELDPKLPVAFAKTMDDARQIAEGGIMPIFFAGIRGAAICDPLNLL